MRTLVMGDSHGAYKGVKQALEQANYIPEDDKLVILGDTHDGWSESPALMNMYIGLSENVPAEQFIYLMGNHDQAYIDWVHNGCKRHYMEGYGGYVTRYVYLNLAVDEIDRHYEWLLNKPLYHLDKDNRLYVHAGWDPEYDWDNPAQATMNEYTCTRKLWEGMFKGRNYAKALHEVFIGHSPTTKYKPFKDEPMNRRNVWNIDTGACFNGRVTVMDVDTKEFWQSDKCQTLYPLERGRN